MAPPLTLDSYANGKEPARKGHRGRNRVATMKETREGPPAHEAPEGFHAGGILDGWLNTAISTPSPESRRNFPTSSAGPTNFLATTSPSQCRSSLPFVRRPGYPILG